MQLHRRNSDRWHIPVNDDGDSNGIDEGAAAAVSIKNIHVPANGITRAALGACSSEGAGHVLSPSDAAR